MASPERTADLRGQLLRFTAIGGLSTLAHALLFLAFRTILPAQSANALALLLTAVANTAANRRVTFAVHGRRRRITHQAQGLVIFTLGLGVTSLGLATLHALEPHAGARAELAVLVAGNLASTVLRFVLFRLWVFARPPASALPTAPAALEPLPQRTSS